MDEALNLKLENQQKLINELTGENEKLYQQFNHLMVRNGKLLKRIDDLQQIIDNMHLRVEELQLINENLLKLGQRIPVSTGTVQPTAKSSDFSKELDSLNRRIDELHLRNDILQKRANLFSSYSSELAKPQETVEVNKPKVNQDVLFTTWKNYPGQDAKNEPNLRKQMVMLLNLFENEALNSADLFNRTGVNGVTGARYVSTLKKLRLIEYTGARKKGHYVITDAGRKLVESCVEVDALTNGPDNTELDFFNPADL